jgi:cytochrome c biogenesis protein CcdA
MTFIYSLGIFTIMLPIVLGARALSLFFFRFHDQSYLVGGIFLLLISFVTLLGIKLPMPKISINQKPGKPDIGSTYLLGLFSGVTSACCAPVLLGVMSLSAFSFSFIGSLGVSLAYVLGMVFPLYIGSYFIDKKNLLNIPFLRKRLYQLSIMGKKYDILATNLIGFLIFLIMGSLIIILASLGKLGMPEDQSGFISVMTNIAEKLTNLSQAIPGLDLLFAVLIVFIIIKLLNFSQRKNEK